MRRVILLGASGSIGRQSRDVLLSYPERFELVGFSLGQRIEAVPEILRDFPSARAFTVQKEEDAEKLRKTYPDLPIYAGDEGLLTLLDSVECDMVVNALVGFAGLRPSIRALELNRILALANKESLVVGGDFILNLLAEGKGKLYPIDSEHVAIAKLFSSVRREDVRRIWITASGGSFRNKTREELTSVTVEDALAHPTWSMGAKITIDSATMMNKGFEIIEADVLFRFGLDRIVPVMHDQSYVHSLLELNDGTFLADISAPDMHGPIEYALMEGDVPFTPVHGKNLNDFAPYSFHEYDSKRFPCVEMAKASHRRGGNSNAILNAANEVAVYAFLAGRIPFLQIEEEVAYALKAVPFIREPSLQDVLDTDALTRNMVSQHIEEGTYAGLA